MDFVNINLTKSLFNSLYLVKCKESISELKFIVYTIIFSQGKFPICRLQGSRPSPLLSLTVYHTMGQITTHSGTKKPVPQLAQDPIVLCLNLWDSIGVEINSSHDC